MVSDLRRQLSGRQAWLQQLGKDTSIAADSHSPRHVLRLEMADKFSRQTAGVQLDSRTTDIIQRRVHKREREAVKAVERCLRARLTPEVEKKMLAALLTLKFSKLPTLSKIAAATTVTDGLGNTRSLAACHPVQALAAVRAGAMAAWPEVDWSALAAACDDVAGLLLGKNQGGLAPAVAQSHAAQLWEDVAKWIERHAEGFRRGEICPGGDIGSIAYLISPTELRKFLDTSHQTATAATSLMAAMADAGTQRYSTVRCALLGIYICNDFTVVSMRY